MKTKVIYPTLLLFAMFGILSSCQKDAASTSSKTTSTTTTATITARTLTGSIVLASVDTASSGKKDTLFLVNCFKPHSKPDSVAFSALPTAIGTYLTANYSGYTFKKAFKITDTTKTVTGYVVIIKYNGNFVGLKFDASGNFVSVLEQMMGQDINNPQGSHPGGPFDDRQGGPAKDTIALLAIPSAVLTYFDTTYPTDTLLHASITPDSTYLLISKNGVLYATNISVAGKLISRIQVGPPAPLNVKSVTQANLLSAITTYLTATYPGYVFNKAFADLNGSTIIGYDVFITANSSNYIVHFDASGNFVKAITLH
ncbi:PepSY-like domain-containing protein [Mucilaginibacter sp. X4EP1]|uniref:PepSY-like domain-containing protein n=1 Tax=Mucilaginibacter sp. X4EP1 TaxID=2723092 RepID=UPI002166CA07|nr:PepSY-like domain-containing protein [Mucilaginibacter sp. X4EP1]MCS3812825.1 hypothetical protein [Mucilaginibacter sp. X4EP1]